MGGAPAPNSKSSENQNSDEHESEDGIETEVLSDTEFAIIEQALSMAAKSQSQRGE